MQDSKPEANVKQAVPSLGVSNMEASLRFYVDGLGFAMTHQWVYEGSVRWCWLQRGGAALMLQDFRQDDGGSWSPEGKLGSGVSIVFICEDALAMYHEVTERGIGASKPFVGNSMWVHCEIRMATASNSRVTRTYRRIRCMAKNTRESGGATNPRSLERH
jgi:lactoylglutathione lyase